MRWNPLADTLIELVQSIVPPAGAGLVVTEAELKVPLEVHIASSRQGLVVLAQPPHSRWKSGFLPPTHMSRISIAVENGDAG
ncbi:MAG TPA: hypothetical protein VGA04_08695 [Streptosporangiaceae bacterium]